MGAPLYFPIIIGYLVFQSMNFCDADISGQVVVLVCLEESQEMDETQE